MAFFIWRRPSKKKHIMSKCLHLVYPPPIETFFIEDNLILIWPPPILAIRAWSHWLWWKMVKFKQDINFGEATSLVSQNMHIFGQPPLTNFSFLIVAVLNNSRWHQFLNNKKSLYYLKPIPFISSFNLSHRTQNRLQSKLKMNCDAFINLSPTLMVSF